MRLNRARALMLVSTLAVGCTINQVSDDDGEDDGSAGESNAGSGGSGKGGSAGSSGKGGSAGKGGGAGEASAGESSSGAPGAAGETAGGAAGEGAGGDGAGGDGVGGDGSAGEANGAGGASGGAAGDGVGGEGGSATCDDDAGTIVTCDGLADTSTCGIADFVEGECTDAETYLKPRVANATRECMIALDETAICDATNTYTCLNDALLDSCPDATATAFCADLGTQCDGTVPENCETYVSGLTAEGRAQFTACVADSWCDLYICVESLGLY